MSLFREIKKRKIQAMRDKDNLVKGVIDDILTHKKFFKVDPDQIQDSDVIAVMDGLKSKYEAAIKGVLQPDPKLNVAPLEESNPFVVENRARVAFLVPYIPEKMSEDEMRGVVESLEFNNIGQFQGHFSKTYDQNFFDRGMLTKLVKEKLGLK